MQLTILGNSGPYPAPGGACSGYLLSQGDTHVLLDCGLGVLARLQEHISLGALSALVLTHLHFDHVSDAFDLAVAMEASGNACPPVFAPETPAPQRALLPAGARFAREFAVGPFSFCLYPARHPVEAYSLVIRCETAKFVFTGDTNWHDGLIEMCQGADLLLADGLFPTEMWQTGLPHLSAAQTAELARDARVKKLVITHLNPNIDPETLLKQARAIRTDAELAHIGATYRV